MSPRLRVLLVVAGAALLAAGAVLGITLATRQTPSQPQGLKGKPPVPRNVPSPVGARITAAFASWPKHSLSSLEELARERPRDPIVQYYLGVALVWDGFDSDAATALRTAKATGRDTPWEVAADNLLHPQYFQGYPVFTPTNGDPLLVRGSRLQSQGHQHSAEKLYQRAAQAHPNDPQALVAAAVGRFDKDNLVPAFSHLGPLTQRFPRNQVVRFYLGYLLAWTGQRDTAVTQFKQAVSIDRSSTLGKLAEDFVRRLEKVRTSPPAR